MKLEFKIGKVSYECTEENGKVEKGSIEDGSIAVELQPSELVETLKVIIGAMKEAVQAEPIKVQTELSRNEATQIQKHSINKITLKLDNSIKLRKEATLTINDIEYRIFTCKQHIIEAAYNGLLLNGQDVEFASDAKVMKVLSDKVITLSFNEVIELLHQLDTILGIKTLIK